MSSVRVTCPAHGAIEVPMADIVVFDDQPWAVVAIPCDRHSIEIPVCTHKRDALVRYGAQVADELVALLQAWADEQWRPKGWLHRIFGHWVEP